MAVRTSAMAAVVSAVLSAAVLGSLTAWADDNPFPGLAGSWSGTGDAVFDSGQSEKMTCKGYYTAHGSAGLGLAIRCANASAKIDLRAALEYEEGNVNGTWEERTYNAGGDVSGKADANGINLYIDGGGLDAFLMVTIKPNAHEVTIATQGSALRKITIRLARGS